MFFVMLAQADGTPAPMVEDDDETVVLFHSREAAERAAAENLLGEAYGCDVFAWDH